MITTSKPMKAGAPKSLAASYQRSLLAASYQRSLSIFGEPAPRARRVTTTARHNGAKHESPRLASLLQPPSRERGLHGQRRAREQHLESSARLDLLACGEIRETMPETSAIVCMTGRRRAATSTITLVTSSTIALFMAGMAGRNDRQNGETQRECGWNAASETGSRQHAETAKANWKALPAPT